MYKTCKVLQGFAVITWGLCSCVSSSTQQGVTQPPPKLLPAVSYLLAESRQALNSGRAEAARAYAERAYALQSQAVEVLLLMAELAEQEGESEDCFAFGQKAQDHLAAPDSPLGLRIKRLTDKCAERIE